MRTHAIDTVVHFAAESHNSLAILDPGLFFRTNVLGTQAMLEAARHGEVTRFHHISTCEVYGDLPLDSDESFSEEDPYRPRTPYNASKAGADHAVRAYIETFGTAATITNCSNNYGPYQFPEKVIPLFAARALDDQPLPLYASTKNRREWLHVVDHCRAIEAVLERGRIGETYHVVRGSKPPSRRSPTPSSTPWGSPVAEGDRPRPARPRPALPPRLHQDPDRAGLGTDRLLRGGTGRDRPLVRRQPVLVGAAAGPGAGGRDLVGVAAGKAGLKSSVTLPVTRSRRRDRP